MKELLKQKLALRLEREAGSAADVKPLHKNQPEGGGGGGGEGKESAQMEEEGGRGGGGKRLMLYPPTDLKCRFMQLMMDPSIIHLTVHPSIQASKHPSIYPSILPIEGWKDLYTD